MKTKIITAKKSAYDHLSNTKLTHTLRQTKLYKHVKDNYSTHYNAVKSWLMSIHIVEFILIVGVILAVISAFAATRFYRYSEGR